MNGISSHMRRVSYKSINKQLQVTVWGRYYKKAIKPETSLALCNCAVSLLEAVLQCCMICSKVFNMFNIGSETSEPVDAERHVS